jgi:hypothetical protein
MINAKQALAPNTLGILWADVAATCRRSSVLVPGSAPWEELSFLCSLWPLYLPCGTVPLLYSRLKKYVLPFIQLASPALGPLGTQELF